MRFLNLAHFIDHYFMLIFPTAVLALSERWGMSYAEALKLGTPAFVLFAAATLPFGWLGDRFGGVPMMRLFFFGMGSSAIAVGFAGGPVMFMAGMAGIGLFAAIYHPVATAMIVALTPERGRALGINGVYGNLGVALAAAITGGLVAFASWRAAFIVPGIVALVMGAFYLRQSRPTTRQGAGEKAPHPEPRPDSREQLRVFIVVGVTALFSGLVFAGVTVSMPKLFEERLHDTGLGIGGIGAITTTVFFSASFTQLFTGRLIDRIGARPILLFASGSTGPLLVALALLPGYGVLPLAVPLMLVIFGAVPVTSWLLSHYVSRAWRSRAYSMQFLLALGVNAGIIPLISGVYEQTGSTAMLFLILAGASLVVFLASLSLPGFVSHIAGSRPLASGPGTA
ncbi:MAG: MFS transporter [Geminicoccaceae bacterium]|nr:MFS transporter [Geminicoccaceae bacterium]